MKMRFLVITVMLTLLVGCGAPDTVMESSVGDMSEEAVLDAVEQAELTSFTFTGYSGPTSHTGTFSNRSAGVVLEDGELVGGVLRVQSRSVDTGISGLDEHLVSTDFFSASTHPEIVFVLTEIEGEEGEGTLTFNGVTRRISVPLERGERSVSTDFLLDTAPFNMSYTAVDDRVRIQGNVTY